MPPEFKDALVRICGAMRAEDQDHFEGGCGDISCAIAEYLRRQYPHVRVAVIGGTAYLAGIGRHTHVWLEIDGETFDPMEAGTNWGYTRHRPGKTPEESQRIIALHGDLEITENWQDSYEKIMLESAVAQHPLPDQFQSHE